MVADDLPQHFYVIYRTLGTVLDEQFRDLPPTAKEPLVSALVLLALNVAGPEVVQRILDKFKG